MASARSGNALGPIQRLFDDGTLTGLTDAQLLDRFLIGRDEAAFAFLVARHGPMVLAVCRGVLRDRDDAEDAFQATFLVLFRKAGGLRAAGSLGSWLYRVAYRIALRANAGAARRRERSSEEDVMAAEAASTGEAGVDREHLPIIHAEIDRLPDRYRAPIALCYLEGLSYEQAAHQLGWPIGTVGSRIARARELLRSRLTRRGVTATTATLAVLLAREATAAPAAWIEATTRAAMGPGGAAIGAKAAGAVSAAVALSDGFLRSMHMIRLIQMSCVLAVAATAGLLAWVSIGHDGGATRLAAPAAASSRPRADPAIDPGVDRPAAVVIRGRVLTPDGKPVRDAAIYAGEPARGWVLEPMTRTDADGRFRFDAEERWRGFPAETIRFDWKKAELMAVASGYGAASTAARNPGGGGVEWRLVPDDMPIRGRVLDMQGRPMAGVTVSVSGIYDPPAGDIDALLESGVIDMDRDRRRGPYDIGWSTRVKDNWVGKTLRTGADGRFRLDGAGRDRLVFLDFAGPGISNSRIGAMTHPAPRSVKSRPRPAMYGDPSRPVALHGATFDHVVVPSKPIEGLVRHKVTGRPVARVLVMGSVKEEPGTRASAVTDKEGRFRLDGLPKVGSYSLYVQPESGQPYLPASLKVADTDGLKPIPVTLDLPTGVVVRLRLIDKAMGKAVDGYSGFHIKLPSNRNEGSAGWIAANFGPEGFRMTVPPGPGFFFAQAAGENLPYTRAKLAPADRGKGVGGETDGEAISVILSPCHAYRIVDVPADAENFAVDLELTRGTTKKGRLVDPEGKPVVGAQAYGLESTWAVKTLEDATFEVTALEPGKPRSVIFTHKGRRLAGAVLLEPGDGALEVRLAPCGAATGRLLDPDGQPITGAYVMLQPEDHTGHVPPGGIGLWPQGEVCPVDKDGRFRVEGLNPALGSLLDARLRSQPGVFLMPEKSTEGIHLKAKPGETLDLGEIRMVRQPNG